MEVYERPFFLDRSLSDLLKPTWEKAIYLLIFLLAVASRFWDLGARAMSHDESLHALYSYYLYSGAGYTHNPMMHGPFLFHANALIYFLFGDNDFTARIVPALFGVFMVMSPLLLRRWLGRAGAVITSILLLISPSFLFYSRYIRNDIYITVWTIVLIAALFHFLEDHKPSWFYVGAAVLMLSLATKENAYIFGFIGALFILAVHLWEKLEQRRQFWLYLAGGAISVVLLLGAFFAGQAITATAEATEGSIGTLKLLLALLTVIGGTMPAILISASLMRSRFPQTSSVQEALRALTWQNWLVAIITMFVIYALLFTTFFTNPVGLGTGIFGSISYWMAQQEVQRGGQPWYYYFLVLIMYEFVPLLFGFIAVLYYLIRGLFPRAKDGDDAETVVEGQRLPWSESYTRFIAFLIFWTLTSVFIYSWAGEKMPWLVVHPVLPLIVISGRFAGTVCEKVNWRLVWQRGGALFALLLPLSLFGIYTLVKLQPFRGFSLSKLQETGNWLAALLVTLLLVVLTWIVLKRLGRGYALVTTLVTVMVFLSFFTIRFAWMASFINYDYATELLVYAHGAADVKPTMAEIAEISQRTVGDKMIDVAYDSDVSWPLEWYMREYPNRKFYGDTPTREKLDVPVILAGDKIDAKVQPFLGDRYYRFKRRLVWWPNQQYMDLSWERIWEILSSPEKREILWKILYYREYPRTPDDWYHVHNMSLYIRKDVAQQLWDFGAVPPEALELPSDPYVDAHVELPTDRVWGSVGTEPGQMNHPRGVATGPDGNLYVVDSDNHRVQVFDPNGTLIREWGSNCNLATNHGCTDSEGNGQFQEPWGIAVGRNGWVYVADTWNHRIQIFDSSGTFLTKLGTYGQTGSDSGLLYGPRDIAVDDEGRVYVTDTGNKRIVVYGQDGGYLGQWGEGGSGPGQFAEPVGIDVDADGNIYVADTWNQRIQVFDPDFTFVREWPVQAWYGESVINKPFLTVDNQGRVYVTDPEGYQCVVFTNEGDLLATFGRYGYDDTSFASPTGIDVSEDGYIYVTDTDGQRVMKFAPLP